MKYLRAMMLGAALMACSVTWATAQVGVGVQLGLGDARDERQAYREGYRQGRWDAEHRRRADADDNRWRESDDRRAYRQGYSRGYNEVSSYRNDRDWDDGHDQNTARQYGYQDGYNNGLRDRQTGHSFRPTHGESYEDADHGYDRRLGDKRYYQQAYREAYTNGYERGYNSGGWYRR